ncbi:MAG: lysylphosphatidylglycerol synthase domain-containing protein [Solirubrobacteraceae bacterium]
MADQPVTGEEFGSVERDAHRLRNGIIWAAALLLLLLAVGLAVPDLRSVLHRAAKAAPGWLIAGVALELASCLGYVATVRLVLRRGPRREVRALAWAEMAFGAVVPVGGAGGLAVGAWAMRAWQLPWSRIANRSAVIFLLTSAVNVFTLALSGIGLMLGIGSGPSGLIYGLIPGATGLAALGLFLALPVVVRRMNLGEHDGRIALVLVRAADWVRDTVWILRERDWRLLGSLAYLMCDIAVLWVCLRAVGSPAPVLAVVVAYQIGYLSNLLPVPGGVGVLEGGLLGALLLYGLPAAPTAAAVVLYHAIALWIPAIGGTLGFVRLRTALAKGPPAELAELRPAVTAPAKAEHNLAA